MTTYHVTLNKSPNGFVAECPALPGCAAHGRSEQEAIHNIKEAITSWMWSETITPGRSQPTPRTATPRPPIRAFLL